LDVINNIVSEEIKVENNYASLLPDKLKGHFPNLTLNNFVFLGLVLVFFCAFAVYFVNL
jgi:hypothetical protein